MVSGELAFCTAVRGVFFSFKPSSSYMGVLCRTACSVSADMSISFMVQEEMKCLIPKVFPSSAQW